MCIIYTCHSCLQPTIIYCSSVDIYTTINPTCHLPTIDPNPQPSSHRAKHRKCPTCTLIRGATWQLQILVFQNPWLSTEGLAGVENRKDWEIGPGVIKTDQESKLEPDWNASPDDHQDTKQQRQMMTTLREMGLDQIPGKETLDEGEYEFLDDYNNQEEETKWEECNSLVAVVNGDGSMTKSMNDEEHEYVLVEVGGQF